MTIAKPPTSAQLNKAIALASRSAIETRPMLYAAGEGDESGDALTPELRDEMLKKLAAGEYVAVDIDMLAFEQQAGVSNRNYVRIRDGALIAMGGTGAGKPFLKDHETYDSMAVAGRILKSKTTKVGDGHYQMRQRARLTAAWAVELALRDLLGAVSIHWESTGPIECSVCNADVRRDGWPCHYPGQRVSELTQGDGTKKYARDPKGEMQVEWIYTSGDLIETSMCPVGAVRTAAIDGIRAALSADGVDLDALFADVDAIDKSTRLAPVPEPVLTPEKPAMADTIKIVILTEAQSALHAKLSADEQTAFLAKSSAERDAQVAAALAADPPIYKTKAGVEIRASHGDVALALAKQGDKQAELLESQSIALEQSRATERLATLRGQIAKDIPALAGNEAVKLAVLGAVVHGTPLPEEHRQGAIEMLRGANALAIEAGTAKGSNPGAAPMPADKTSAFAALDKGLAAYCKANNVAAVWTEGLAAFAATTEGKALADAYNATLA